MMEGERGLMRDIGAMEADVAMLKQKVDSIDKDVKAILRLLAEARGGGRVVVWLVALGAGALGSVVAWVMGHLK